MKLNFFAVITIVVFAGICFVETHAQSRLDLKNKSVKDEVIVEILTESERRILNPSFPKINSLYLRLYSIGVSGDCAPEIETEVTCSFKYYLTASSGDLGVSGAVYDLGEVGEITKLEWLENSDRDFARLRLEVINYPEIVFRENPKLIKKTKIVEIEISLQALKIKDIK